MSNVFKEEKSGSCTSSFNKLSEKRAAAFALIFAATVSQGVLAFRNNCIYFVLDVYSTGCSYQSSFVISTIIMIVENGPNFSVIAMQNVEYLSLH